MIKLENAMARVVRGNPILARLADVLLRLRFFREAYVDAWRRYQFSAPTSLLFRPSTPERSRQSQLQRDLHSLEKGASLAAPRAQFGLDAIKRIQFVSTNSSFRGSELSISREETAVALRAVLNWHDSGLKKDLDPLLTQIDTTPFDSLEVEISRSLLLRRRSVRNFVQKPVEERLLLSAVDFAKYAPSVCNRQSWRVIFLENSDARHMALDLQNGNKGFGEGAPIIGVICSDLRDFAGPGERSQMYVDGGMFAMNLLTGLHLEGLSTCCLNWSMPNSISRKFRSALNIPTHEEIIMLIAVGYVAKEAKSALSKRKSTGNLVQVIR